MRTLRNRLVVLAAVASLMIGIGSIMNLPVAAQGGGPQITIQGPLPLPVDDSSQTVLIFDQVREVGPGGPGTLLGPIDVSSFRQIRVASRLVTGAAASVTVTPVLQMASQGVSTGFAVLAPSTNLNGSSVVDVPGGVILIHLSVSATTTGHFQVYGRK